MSFQSDSEFYEKKKVAVEFVVLTIIFIIIYLIYY